MSDTHEPTVDEAVDGELDYDPTNDVTEDIELDIADITIDKERIQTRKSLDLKAVASYKQLYVDDRELDPVDVFDWAEPSGPTVHLLAEGFHRMEAYGQLLQDGKLRSPLIRCRRHYGDWRAARIFNTYANHKSRVRWTRADIHRAIQLALEDEKYVNWSDGRIAKYVAYCDPHTVKRQRHKLGKFPSRTDGKVLGVDGVMHPYDKRKPDDSDQSKVRKEREERSTWEALVRTLIKHSDRRDFLQEPEEEHPGLMVQRIYTNAGTMIINRWEGDLSTLREKLNDAHEGLLAYLDDKLPAKKSSRPPPKKPSKPPPGKVVKLSDRKSSRPPPKK